MTIFPPRMLEARHDVPDGHRCDCRCNAAAGKARVQSDAPALPTGDRKAVQRLFWPILSATGQKNANRSGKMDLQGNPGRLPVVWVW